jgi:hypothetical protein
MITGDIHVSDLFSNDPGLMKVFVQYGLQCPSCKGIEQDTIARVAVNNGLNLDEFLLALNKAGK